MLSGRRGAERDASHGIGVLVPRYDAGLGITAAVPFVLGGAVVWLLLCTVLSGLPGAAAARDYRGLGDRTTAK